MVVKLLGVVLLIAGFALANGNIEDPPVECLTLSRGNFDALDRDFIFGTASASYQFEGAAFEDGRTPSIWDHYAHNHSERIRDHKNADVTVDQYHRYKEDVQIMKNLNTDAYRFSISWSRVLPTGKLSGGVNRLGIQYYNNLIDELIKNGITPYVTIFHWDLPQSLEEEFGGFLSPRIVGHFRDFAEVLFMNFGDRVKYWITLNEPFTFTNNGYAVGTFAPGRCSRWQTAQNCLGGDSATEPYAVTHHLLLCHAAAVQLYRTKYQVNQKGVIGITLVTIWPEPISDAQEDKDAANRFLDFMYGWYMHPIVYGDYPYSMRSTVGQRLPFFTEEESQLLKGSYDFIGVNYYSARYASNMAPSEHASYTTDHNVNLTTMRDGVLIGPMNGSDWICAYPKGFENILLYTKEKYNDPLIYITENGISEIDNPNSPLKLPGALDDVNRVDYYQRHLCHLLTAMKKGVKVKGYFAWSLLDNYEWECGYTHRFGIIYVDYKNGLTRHYTSSAKWFHKFLSRSGPPGKIECE